MYVTTCDIAHEHSAGMNCAMITQVAPCTFSECGSKVPQFIAFLSAIINNRRQRSEQANMITQALPDNVSSHRWVLGHIPYDREKTCHKAPLRARLFPSPRALLPQSCRVDSSPQLSPTLTTSIHITCKLAKFYFQARSTFDPNRL